MKSFQHHTSHSRFLHRSFHDHDFQNHDDATQSTPRASQWKRHLAISALFLSVSITAQAQPTLMTPPVVSTPATTAPVKTPSSSASKTTASKTTTSTTTSVTVATPNTPVAVAVKAPAVSASAVSSNAILININGRSVATDPAPILQKGSVLVPLRGVLENLGAKVTYDAATSRIDILQNKKRYSLKVGETSAAVENSVVSLAAAPINIGGRTFVPLRSLAELFGYEVSWLPAIRTVAIKSEKTGAPIVKNPTVPVIPSSPVMAGAEHKAALKAAGRYGVTINFHDISPNEIESLLDAAKKSGAGLVKFRFDWNTLEPTQGSAFQWPVYDRVVKGARERGLLVVGVLGNTTRWATLFPRSESAGEWRNSPPKPALLPAWDNYVRRVVGRYGKDVQAWQIWENPASYNFRSGARDYRIVTKRALDAARVADPKAILFAAEPGGVNLGFVEDLRRNGLLQQVSGVSLYPVSQWQPGVPAQAEEAVLPITTLLRDPVNRDKSYWVNGLSRMTLEAADLQSPRAETVFNTKDQALQRSLVQAFTPGAQADYLVRSMTLALAAGAEKVFWGDLRDAARYDRIDPVNSFYGGGLLREDSTPRPAFSAYTNLTKLIGEKKFIGAAAAGPRAVVLVFEDARGAVAVAWAAPGQEKNPPRLALDPARDPGLPGAVYLETLGSSRVLDSTGEEVGGSSGSIVLSQRPVWITDLSFKVAQNILDTSSPGPFRLTSQENNADGAETLRAVFAPDSDGVEQGLFWRKYLGFRGSARDFGTAEGITGLKTIISRDVYNPAAGQPNIYLDVANDFMYFARGRAVTVTVDVKRPAVTTGPFAAKGGFNIQYDSPKGFRSTPWKVVEGGEGWQTFVIEIPDASFANRDGFDLMINTWGAKQDLIFRSLTLKKNDARVAAEAADNKLN